ncbi:glucosamine--fructose-6-phosphate aminotransferase [Halovivax asiaticus JCM 14624]|uniref:Glutamine--fructose-6-phosphate aminotransferase [isomerizing] n=1 Tax=Halovivax asiaticus JCM 14624 TaxID=1227490 RepID=M0BW31_9EURY|nr:glutamine--fructose-6-phosphate transaminase (isomerizing) [Halovivax asiaticus]ELZ13864.1 glucosamine--fructose-6-phosphate aminotransferase [Halovivax asiaticus JCM 14624]
MCGIFGYVGMESAGPIVYRGLETLEYRGYDSAGIALREDGSDTLSVAKRAGEVSALSVPDESASTCAIGHTRWSTHGPPTDANAHPHTDCADSVAVVHNGIVENHEELAEELADHTFTSETDTEVIPHLLEAAFDENASEEPLDGSTSRTDGGSATDGVSSRVATELRRGVESVTDRLEGSYAVAAVHTGADCIVATRQESPLVVGHGEDASYLASDVPALVEHTREVTYLEDGDIAVLQAGEVSIYRDGERVEPTRSTIDWDADAAQKGGYEHYMRKEIHEQPTALRQTLGSRVDVNAGTASLDVDFPKGYLESLEEIQLLAMGTSYYAGQYAATLFESLAGVRATPVMASEYTYTGGRDPWRTLSVAVTQSGETADTLGALREAGAAGARTLGVTNTLGSSVTREADDALFIRAGPEIGVAATKTFASQVSTLALLAIAIGRERGELSAAEARSHLEDLTGLPGAIQQVLDEEARIRETAHEYADSDAFFFVGREYGHPVALEGALKLKEISYDHAEGFAAGELKHGPLALVTDQTPVLAVLTEGSRPQETLNNVAEVQARGAPTIGVTSDDVAASSLTETFDVPDAGIFEPLVANVYFQLFAYHVANAKGRSIDKPRNLAKSVTVE